MTYETQNQPLRLKDVLSFRLSVLSNVISKQIASQYQAKYGLSLWQWRVMAVIGERDGLSASDIVGATAMDKVAVSRAVTGLIDRGALTRSTSEQDARRSHLSLTLQGRRLYDDIVPLVEADLERIVSPLTATEREQLETLMAKLAGSVSPERPLW